MLPFFWMLFGETFFLPAALFSVNHFSCFSHNKTVLPGVRDWIKFFPLSTCRIISSARAGIVVLMILCAAPDVGWNSAFLFIVFIFLLGITNGIVSCACFMQGPTLAKESKRADAGSVHVLALFSGGTVGFYAAEPFALFVIDHGVSALILAAGVVAVLPWSSFVGGLMFRLGGCVKAQAQEGRDSLKNI